MLCAYNPYFRTKSCPEWLTETFDALTQQCVSMTLEEVGQRGLEVRSMKSRLSLDIKSQFISVETKSAYCHLGWIREEWRRSFPVLAAWFREQSKIHFTWYIHEQVCMHFAVTRLLYSCFDFPCTASWRSTPTLLYPCIPKATVHAEIRVLELTPRIPTSHPSMGQTTIMKPSSVYISTVCFCYCRSSVVDRIRSAISTRVQTSVFKQCVTVPHALLTADCRFSPLDCTTIEWI